MSQMTQAAALILLKPLFKAKRTQPNASTMVIMFVQATSFQLNNSDESQLAAANMAICACKSSSACAEWMQHRALRADWPQKTKSALLLLHSHSRRAFIGGLGFSAVQERISRKAVRNRGYLLTKTLKTHDSAFTAVFCRLLVRRLISGWLLIVCLQNNDRILFILV